MPSQLQNRTVMVFAAMLAMIAMLGFAIGQSGPGLASEPSLTLGRLDIDGVSYEFAPTTCTVTDTDFVAAGSGLVEGEPFWVSASRERVDLTIGPESAVDRPDQNQTWLTSVEAVAWSAENEAIHATTMLADERKAEAPRLFGALQVECAAPPAGA